MNLPRIFLTGFMGSGKSTLGKKLAALLQVDFYDLDEEIEKAAGKKVGTLFEEEGEPQFRELESKILDKLMERTAPYVLSLGGGTVCQPQNLEKIRRSGLLVYLRLGPETLAQRLLSAKTQRPLLKNIPPRNYVEFIRNKLLERDPFYTQAHLSVDGLNLTAHNLHKKIRDVLQEKSH